MKQLCAMLSLVLLLSAGIASAEGKKKALADDVSGQGYGMAGCGLGSIIFGSKPGMIQIVAATFNGTGGSQTFGITFGTSNCVADGGSGHAELFIIGNREALQNDISRGNGEALTNLAQIIGCSGTKTLGTKLQSNYQSIFPSQNAPAEAVAGSILNTIKHDSQLLIECENIG